MANKSKKMQECENNLQILDARRRELQGKQNTAQRNIGPAEIEVAKCYETGADATAAQAALQKLQNELTGIGMALERVEAAERDVHTEITAVREHDAGAALRAATQRHTDAVKAADLALREFWHATLGPLAAQVMEAQAEIVTHGGRMQERHRSEHDYFLYLIKRENPIGLIEYIEHHQKPAIPGYAPRRRAVSAE